ncbi:MAG: helix-turn-helix transcriptional regulator [Actinomycetia bacterium]|nr:helix-turn-helix transcriptional regulator [Actinomycetes bacterium]
MTRAAAGSALRALRESRDWSLADLATATGVSIMGLSYLERGARKPHKSTVQKVENGLGLPPGSYARLLAATDPAAELAQLAAASPTGRVGRAQVVVSRHSDTDVFEAHARAHIDSLTSLIARLPAETSNEYETYILSVIAQCVTAENLTANSWRVAVNAGSGSADGLMSQLQTLEGIRTGLLDRIPAAIGAQLDQACRGSGLPDAVVAELLGVTAEEMWDIRNRGRIPPGALPRVRAFVGQGIGESQA